MDEIGVLVGAVVVAMLLVAMWRVVMVVLVGAMLAVWLVGAVQVVGWIQTWT